jgi:hypothetical protein
VPNLQEWTVILQFLVIIIIIKLILLKIRVRTVKFQIYKWQRATVSGAFETVARFIIFMKRATVSGAFASYIYKVRSSSPSHLHGVWTKHTTGSGTFYKNDEK